MANKVKSSKAVSNRITKSKILTTSRPHTVLVQGRQIKTPEVLPGGKLNNFLNDWSSKLLNFKKSKTFYIILVALGILLLAFFKKPWFVAAVVNGMPITNLELQTKLNEQFRTQSLNQLVNEKIIMDEARKNAAIPNELEINNKLADLEKNVGGKEALDTLLSQQGQTKISLRDQLRVQLAISKLYDLYDKEASVSGDEVSKFIEQNKQLLRATDSAQQEKEAYDSIKNQKLSQIFSQKFQELRTKANIKIF